MSAAEPSTAVLSYPEQQRDASSWCVPANAEHEPDV